MSDAVAVLQEGRVLSWWGERTAIQASVRRLMQASAVLVFCASHAAACDLGLRAGMDQIETWLGRAGAELGLLAATQDDPLPDAQCIECHGDAAKLIGMVVPPEAPPEDGCATAPSRPPFLGYFVNPEFAASDHGQLGCIACHGGDGEATEYEAAHAEMRSGLDTCDDCHQFIVDRHDTSLHHTLSGMRHALELRAGETNMDALGTAWEADCATCHTSCSDCHLSLPAAVGGGLIQGHSFLRRAPMEDSCALCHGSRAGAEYLGNNHGVGPDVHFQEGMHCLDCHENDLHGDRTVYENRWEVSGRAACTDCHPALPRAPKDEPTPTFMGLYYHSELHADVACQVCHATPYQACFNCHTGEEDGEYFRRAGSKRLVLKFGRNTVEGYPYDVVTLRNNPVARDSFVHFGAELLPGFDGEPTWKTAAPHNIQRITGQNVTCYNCHDDPSLFLTPDDLDPEGAAANVSSLIDPQ